MLDNIAESMDKFLSKNIEKIINAIFSFIAVYLLIENLGFEQKYVMILASILAFTSLYSSALVNVVFFCLMIYISLGSSFWLFLIMFIALPFYMQDLKGYQVSILAIWFSFTYNGYIFMACILAWSLFKKVSTLKISVGAVLFAMFAYSFKRFGLGSALEKISLIEHPWGIMNMSEYDLAIDTNLYFQTLGNEAVSVFLIAILFFGLALILKYEHLLQKFNLNGWKQKAVVVCILVITFILGVVMVNNIGEVGAKVSYINIAIQTFAGYCIGTLVELVSRKQAECENVFIKIEQEPVNIAPLWEGWETENLIGRGSFGEVYRIKKTLLNKEHFAAVKKLILYNAEDVDNVVKEINLLMSLKGHPNIVSCDDYKIIKETNTWAILIKMEMLSALDTYLKTKKMNEIDVLKLGIDISKGLEECHSKKIIHRDIKPQNIFVSNDGTYKLGDFGISKALEDSDDARTRIGTLSYMAPEIFLAKPYDHTVDIYSLCLVMYVILNDGKSPFMDKTQKNITKEQKDQAFSMRIEGKSLPILDEVSSDLMLVLRKGCESNLKLRYKDIKEFRIELERILRLVEENEEQTEYLEEETCVLM